MKKKSEFVAWAALSLVFATILRGGDAFQTSCDVHVPRRRNHHVQGNHETKPVVVDCCGNWRPPARIERGIVTNNCRSLRSTETTITLRQSSSSSTSIRGTVVDAVILDDSQASSKNARRYGGNGNGNGNGNGWIRSLRASGRVATGVSWTAIRASGRAATGISLTATRTFCRTATGVSVTAVLKTIVGAFPLWVRYFMQPFLILYYTPFVVVRSIIETRSEARKTHEHFVEAIREAVQVAEKVNESGYWPVYVDEDGSIQVKAPPDIMSANLQNEAQVPELADCIVESVQVAAAVTATVIEGGDGDGAL